MGLPDGSLWGSYITRMTSMSKMLQNYWVKSSTKSQISFLGWTATAGPALQTWQTDWLMKFNHWLVDWVGVSLLAGALLKWISVRRGQILSHTQIAMSDEYCGASRAAAPGAHVCICIPTFWSDCTTLLFPSNGISNMWIKKYIVLAWS